MLRIKPMLSQGSFKRFKCFRIDFALVSSFALVCNYKSFAEDIFRWILVTECRVSKYLSESKCVLRKSKRKSICYDKGI